MRVLVTGGRSLDHNKVCAWLFANATDLIGEGPHFVIEGGADGADKGARYWRETRRFPGQTYPADWTTHKRAAGPIRNAQMLKQGKPSVVIAFPGHEGTADAVDRARAAGVRVIEAAGDFAQ